MVDTPRVEVHPSSSIVTNLIVLSGGPSDMILIDIGPSLSGHVRSHPARSSRFDPTTNQISPNTTPDGGSLPPRLGAGPSTDRAICPRRPNQKGPTRTLRLRCVAAPGGRWAATRSTLTPYPPTPIAICNRCNLTTKVSKTVHNAI